MAVVFYHAGLGSTAGYLGVDAFFVIAGFLMYRQLRDEYERTASFSVRLYLTRRARRLMPLSMGVAILTLLLSIPFSTTQEQLYISAAGLAILIHVTNFWAYANLGDYFGVDAEAIPFLHYWSLAAEEQLFILFAFSSAIFLHFCQRFRVKQPLSTARIAVGGILLASLALNLYLQRAPSGTFGLRDPASFGFFAPLTRIWQFSLGILIAMNPNRLVRSRRIFPVWSVSAVTFTGLLFFPVSTALAPDIRQMGATLACAFLLLLGGSTQLNVSKSTIIQKCLFLVGRVGDHSYSLYLIHWPLLVFSNHLFGSALHVRLASVTLAGVCSAFASKAIENPFRSLSITSPVLLRSLVIGSSALLACSIAVRVGAGSDWGHEVEAQDPLSGSECTDISGPKSFDAPWCYLRMADGAPTVLLIGDSHATSLSRGFVDAAEMTAVGAAFSARSSCPFSTVVLRGNRAQNCRSWQEAILQVIGTLRPEVVVVANYETSYQKEPYGRLESAQGERAFTEREAIELWREGLDTMIRRVRSVSPSSSVLLVSQVPEMEKFQARRSTIFDPNPTPVRLYRSDTLAPQERFRSASFRLSEIYEYVYVLDSTEFLCDARFCYTGDSEGWWYGDHHHLNNRGSARLGVPLANIFEQILEARTMALETD